LKDENSGFRFYRHSGLTNRLAFLRINGSHMPLSAMGVDARRPQIAIFVGLVLAHALLSNGQEA
jgi:hypothetical protein